MFSFKLLKSIVTKVLPFSALLFLPACSTIINGTHQTINVDTGAVKEATCHLENSKGKWTVDSTPGPISVKRANEKLCVTCHKKQLKGNTDADSKIKSTTL